jgi:3-oxoacyl-[acyl-carrier protein] reductase
MNRIDLGGRVAVVTGGAQGFGRAIAERFSASGAKVAIWDMDQIFAQRTANDIGNGTKSYGVDVSDPAAVEKARDATLKDFGKIDILVNNAGIAGVNRTVWETDFDQWKKVLRINLDGPFVCCKAVVPHMIEKKYGRIVNIASIAGKEGMARIAPYSAAKAGVIGFTKAIAKELVDCNVLVNAVAPVITETDLFKEMTQEHISGAKARIPMGRFLTIPEIAALVAWIGSKECSFTTGFCFDISGGRATY